MTRFARPFSASPVVPRRPRAGCLGCLSQLLLMLVLGGALVLLTIAVSAHWGFFFGGRFHIIPFWQVWGVLHAKSGNYVIFVGFQPRPSGSRIMPGPSVGGNGYLG